MGESREDELWRPAAEIAAEVAAALAAAGEVVAEDGVTLDSESEGTDKPGSADEPTIALPWVAEPAQAPTIALAAVVPPARQAPEPQPAAEPMAATEQPAAAELAPPNVFQPAPPIAAPAPSVLTPDQISRHIARAEALAELGRRQQALDVLNELIVAGAEDVRVWRTLAAVYLETGDGEKALRAADWVVTFAPGDEWGYRLRASALRLLQRPDEAVHAAEQAVRLAPDVWQGRATLAMALQHTGDLTKAAEEARKATELAAKLDPELAPEAKQVENAVTEAEDLVGDLEAVLAGRPGPDDESLAHVGNLVLRSLEFSAAAGWLISFGGLTIPGFNVRFLIPLAVLVILSVFLFGPARKAGRDLWRYLVEYLWQDTNTRVALLMTVAAHVWMITGASVGHVQGASTLTVGVASHLIGRLVLAKKAPEINPVKRGAPAAPRGAA